MNYGNQIPDELKSILIEHFEKGKPLPDLHTELDDYATKSKDLSPVELNDTIQSLRLCMNASKYGWEFYHSAKLILDHYLIQAVKTSDTKTIGTLLEQYKQWYAFSPVNSDLQNRLDTYFENLTNDTDIQTRLSDSVKTGKLSLIIGAGVTREYIGNWDELLKRMMVMRCYSTLMDILDDKAASSVTIENMNDFMEKHIKTFIGDNVNYLERGEYLRFDSGDRSTAVGTEAENKYRELFFAEQVRQTVIELLNKTDSTGAKIPVEKQFIDKYIDGSGGRTTLTELVRLCVRQDVSEIVTYNFDTIFDRLLADPYIRNYYKPGAEKVRVEAYSYSKNEPLLVLPDGAPKSWKTIRIYHVHGLVDEEVKEIHPIIFSENSYQNYQKTALNWSNIHIADIQSRYDVLCVGFSGDDPNFRSLRRFFEETNTNPVMGRAERTSLFLMREYSSDLKKLLDPETADKDIDFAYACIITYFDVVISYFRKQYNVDIVWSNSFNHMAEQLNRLALL